MAIPSKGSALRAFPKAMCLMTRFNSLCTWGVKWENKTPRSLWDGPRTSHKYAEVYPVFSGTVKGNNLSFHVDETSTFAIKTTILKKLGGLIIQKIITRRQSDIAQLSTVLDFSLWCGFASFYKPEAGGRGKWREVFPLPPPTPPPLLFLL